MNFLFGTPEEVDLERNEIIYILNLEDFFIDFELDYVCFLVDFRYRT